MTEKDTKQKILDAAEDLFADKGYHATSLRAITNEAGVNLAAVNYHFGSKEELVAEVIRRRLAPLNDRRLEQLRGSLGAAKEKGERPQARDILMAFIEPTVKFRYEMDVSASFITLIGRALAEPDNSVRKFFMELMQPLFKEFFEALSEALPEVPHKILFWRLHFTIGATSHLLHCIGKCPMGIHGEFQVNDAQELIDMVIPFVATGMEAPL